MIETIEVNRSLKTYFLIRAFPPIVRAPSGFSLSLSPTNAPSKNNDEDAGFNRVDRSYVTIRHQGCRFEIRNPETWYSRPSSLSGSLTFACCFPSLPVWSGSAIPMPKSYSTFEVVSFCRENVQLAIFYS